MKSSEHWTDIEIGAIGAAVRKVWHSVPAALVLSSACVLGGCSGEVPSDEKAAPVSVATEGFTTIGTIFHNGMKLRFDRMNATDLDLSKTVGLTACDSKTLYAVRKDTNGHKVLASTDAGETFSVIATGWGPEIACDHGMLAALNSTKKLYTTQTKADGSFVTGWADRGQADKVDRIQGGDGMFYGVKVTASGNQVFTATNYAWGEAPVWGASIATIGAVRVTGMGAKQTGSNHENLTSSAAWPRRAFALEANGTVSYNDQLLDGGNLWTWLNTGTERYTTLTAAATTSKTSYNALFGLQDKDGDGTVELQRIRIYEDDCDDGVDNDANGFTDGSDLSCESAAATAWCASHANGTYCNSRFPTGDWAGGFLTRCTSGGATRVGNGVCEQSGSNADFLLDFNTTNLVVPSGYARWCSAHWLSGGWGLNTTSPTPCEDLVAAGGTVVRAGVYSVSGKNHVLANCTDGAMADDGDGGEPIATVYNAVGKTTNRCVFTISPDKLPVFDRMFDDGHEVSGRVAFGFTHAPGINRFGTPCDGNNPCNGEPAYDHALNEGRPVYAVAFGKVVDSRDRDLSETQTCNGTPHQGEIYVEHRVGPNATYRESFITYYAHLRKRVVQTGHTVRVGQILGYVGGTGCTGGLSHLHTGVFRLTNVNAQTATNPAFGWQLGPFFKADVNEPTGNNLNNTISIDALGWAGSGLDPWGHANHETPNPGYSFVGQGAWSIALFKDGKAFDYP